MSPRIILGSIILASAGALCCAFAAQDKAVSIKVDLKKMKATVSRLETPVTLELNDIPLADVLKFLEQYAQMKFAWDYELLPDKAVAITATDEPLGESLQKVLDQCQWTFAIRPNGEVFLQPVPEPKKRK